MKNDKIEKKIRKRRILLKLCMFIIFIAAIITFGLKSEYFKVTNVVVKDNKYVQTKEVTGMVNLSGENIFMVRGIKVKDLLSNNPYIEDISLRKRLPGTIEIYIKEKDIRGLVQFKSGFINVDSEGRMVQIVNQFPGKDLPLIDGVKIDQYIPEECIIKKDDIKVKALKECLKVSDIKELKNVTGKILDMYLGIDEEVKNS
jgi:cell division protein FtsQ